jgi:Transposase
MQTVTTIGFDIAKSVFQVHGVDAGGEVVIRRQLKRRHVLAFFQKLSPCLIGIEACASSHHWSRELHALGHTVKLMPPAYVKPYVKRQKNDMADAEAICEAVTRANMRFVPTKTPVICSSVSRPLSLTRFERTSPSSGLWRRSGVKGSRNCCALLLTQMTSECRRLPAAALARSVLNCLPSRSRFWSLIGGS